MEIRLAPVGSRYVRRQQALQIKERRAFANWGWIHEGRKLVQRHLEELEERPVKVFRLEEDREERSTGPFPPGFDFHKKKLDFLAGIEVDEVADRFGVEEFVKSIKMPADAETRAVLYEKGRTEYLKERQKLPPCKRHRYPLSVNWENGWWQDMLYADKKLPTPEFRSSHANGTGARQRKHGIFQPYESPSAFPQFRSIAY